ncbi:MAG: exopolysaccharide transport family protein [Alsobacter sp.]
MDGRSADEQAVRQAAPRAGRPVRVGLLPRLGLLGALLGVGAGFGAYTFVPRSYTAVASLSVEMRDGVVPTAQQVEAQIRQATSTPVLLRVIAAQKLVDDLPALTAAGSRLDTLAGMVGLAGAPVGEARAAAAARALASLVTVTAAPGNDSVDVAVSASDPDRAAALANGVVQAAAADRAEARSEAVRQAAQREALRLQTLQTRLLDAEAKLATARAQTGLAGDPRAELVQARAATAEARHRLDVAQRLASASPGRDTDPDGPRSPVLDRMRAQVAELARVEAGYRQTLGPRHPLMLEAQQQLREARRGLDQEVRRSVEAARAELASSQATEDALTRRAETVQKSTDPGPVRLRSLETEVETHRAAFDRAVRERSTEDASDLMLPRVVTVASAGQATGSPRLTTCVSAGALTGFGFGLLTGCLLLWRGNTGRKAERPRNPATLRVEPPLEAPAPEETDRQGTDRQGTEEAVSEPQVLMDTPVVVAPQPASPSLPPAQKVRRTPAAAPARWTAADADPVDASAATPEGRDAVAELVADLLATGPADGPATVLVTSLLPRVGKTPFALELARSATALGGRVLLIDANRGSPTLSMTFGLGAAPGLLKAGSRLRPVHALDGRWDRGLFFMPVDTGPRTRLPDHAQVRFDGMARHFTLIVIDGAVAGTPGGDARLAAGADRVLVLSTDGHREGDIKGKAAALLHLPRARLRDVALAA